MRTGIKPDCIFVESKFDDRLDNFLKIDASGSSDLVIKMVNSNTKECIRSVFINGGDTYFIKNIPQGIYHLKIAFGYDWAIKSEGEFCFAKFLRDVHYEEGTDQLDFNVIKNDNEIQTPSFELILKTRKNSRNNEFESENISEDEFYR